MKEKLRGKTILIVDDEERIRHILRMALEREGFEVLEAEGGYAAKEIYEKYDPCFIILDIVLPDIDGKEICTWLRAELNSNVPIIMISALTEEKDRIKGLRLGADDYLTKPFSLEELVTRVETVLRRTANRCSKISYRGLVLKPIVGKARFEDTVLDLTHSEYKILSLFMTHPDQVFTREQMVSYLYSKEEKVINERTMDVHVKHLREKIAEHSDYLFIETVRGIGYRFNT